MLQFVYLVYLDNDKLITKLVTKDSYICGQKNFERDLKWQCYEFYRNNIQFANEMAESLSLSDHKFSFHLGE